MPYNDADTGSVGYTFKKSDVLGAMAKVHTYVDARRAEYLDVRIAKYLKYRKIFYPLLNIKLPEGLELKIRAKGSDDDWWPMYDVYGADAKAVATELTRLCGAVEGGYIKLSREDTLFYEKWKNR